MTQYFVRALTDFTGHKFTHVTKARENETFVVVEAESKEEALSYNEVSGDKKYQRGRNEKTIKGRIVSEYE